MNKPYLVWAFVGMVGYSFIALFVKLAVRGGGFSSFFVLVIASAMVVTTATCITFLRGDIKALTWNNLATLEGAFAIATGIALTIAVASYFLALSMGPASVVVPIYGMFIVGGAVPGLIFFTNLSHPESGWNPSRYHQHLLYCRSSKALGEAELLRGLANVT